MINRLCGRRICTQIYAYVSNADRQHTGNVSGLLVYAKTQEELLPDCMYNMGGNHIGAVTLDLSRDFFRKSRRSSMLSQPGSSREGQDEVGGYIE